MHKKSLLLLLSLHSLNAEVISHSDAIENISKKYLGQPYVWGGNTPETGMDCSGYTRYVYNKVGIKIPRTALTQSKIGKTVDYNHLKKGDLLFFLTDKKRGIPITHVGIYLSNNKFIHAASKKKGIIISSLNGKYGKLFVKAKRVISKDKKIVVAAKENTQTYSEATSISYDNSILLAFSSILDHEASNSKMEIITTTMEVTKTSFDDFKKL